MSEACEAEYEPGVDRREWPAEAVLAIGLEAGWREEGVADEWRRLADTFTVEQLDRW